ncbi:hypothetical protein EVAR_99172_1 [Eumeta japonica]|uniref:Uncharacterized protein n=1 Tax=Eumeta variegata TaxID=151549 RepID=A0A4C1T681_EUMVA|nr:hypothetical protein EVAR_99172_1 [Eumeta japonica]
MILRIQPLHLTWKKRHRKILHSARFLALQVGRVRRMGEEEAGRASQAETSSRMTSIREPERGDRIQKFTESKKLNAPTPTGTAVALVVSTLLRMRNPLFAPICSKGPDLKPSAPTRAGRAAEGRDRRLKVLPEAGASESTNAKTHRPIHPWSESNHYPAPERQSYR